MKMIIGLVLSAFLLVSCSGRPVDPAVCEPGFAPIVNAAPDICAVDNAGFAGASPCVEIRPGDGTSYWCRFLPGPAASANLDETTYVGMEILVADARDPSGRRRVWTSMPGDATWRRVLALVRSRGSEAVRRIMAEVRVPPDPSR